MKPAFLILLLLAAILSGCMTAPTPPGHATVTLHDAQGLPAATVATLQPANPETAAQVTLRRKGDQVEISTTTGRSRALEVPAVAGLPLWTIFGAPASRSPSAAYSWRSSPRSSAKAGSRPLPSS